MFFTRVQKSAKPVRSWPIDGPYRFEFRRLLPSPEYAISTKDIWPRNTLKSCGNSSKPKPSQPSLAIARTIFLDGTDLSLKCGPQPSRCCKKSGEPPPDRMTANPNNGKTRKDHNTYGGKHKIKQPLCHFIRCL